MLSVVLAVYNEEKNIGKCLESVKSLAGEIVVIDGTSSDKTVEIAKQFGALVTITDNPPIFHINKQKAVNQSNGDWILQLDADEIMTKELAEEITTTITSNNANDGYYLKRKNYFLGRWLSKGGQYPDPVIRLFKKGKGTFPCKSVHEQIEITGTVGTLQNDLMHFMARNLDKYLENSDRYTTLTAKEWSGRYSFFNPVVLVKYLFIMPVYTFMMLYFRHKGLVDGFPGFIFAFFSGFHFVTAYVKFLGMKISRTSS